MYFQSNSVQVLCVCFCQLKDHVYNSALIYAFIFLIDTQYWKKLSFSFLHLVATLLDMHDSLLHVHAFGLLLLSIDRWYNMIICVIDLQNGRIHCSKCIIHVHVYVVSNCKLTLSDYILYLYTVPIQSNLVRFAVYKSSRPMHCSATCHTSLSCSLCLSVWVLDRWATA